MDLDFNTVWNPSRHIPTYRPAGTRYHRFPLAAVWVQLVFGMATKSAHHLVTMCRTARGILFVCHEIFDHTNISRGGLELLLQLGDGLFVLRNEGLLHQEGHGALPGGGDGGGRGGGPHWKTPEHSLNFSNNPTIFPTSASKLSADLALMILYLLKVNGVVDILPQERFAIAQMRKDMMERM